MAARSPFFSSSFLDQFQLDLGARDLNQQQRQREAIERRRNFADLVPCWFDEFQDFYHSDSEQSVDDGIHLPPHFSVEIDSDVYSNASDLIENGVDSVGGVLDRVDFVRNLFQDRVDQQESERERERVRMSRSGFGVVDDVDESNYLDLDLGLDLGLGLNFGDENGDLLAGEVEEDDDVVFLGNWRINGVDSTRVFGSRLGSEEVHRHHDVSDLCSEEEEFHLEFENTLDDGIDDGSEGLCWNSLQLEDHSQTEADEELEWEELADGDEVLEREVLNVAFGIQTDDVVDSALQQQNYDTVPDRVVNGWEVLLNEGNVGGRNLEFGNEDMYFGPDGYLYTDEFESEFESEFTDNDSGVISKPPAAKSSVENLPTVLVTQVDVESSASLCAVCKDEMHVGEKAKKLPCSLSYHGDCIIPWLAIRNTCPVCRFELPTDDPAYERRRRTQRESTGN